MLNQDTANIAWQQRAEIALTSALLAGQTITYAELADAATIPNPNRIHKLTAWLEDTMRIDYAAKKPLRAALVISRNRGGLPAPGFFMLCNELGIFQGATSGPFASRFHQTIINDLWSEFGS